MLVTILYTCINTLIIAESKAELYFLYQNTYLDQDFVRLEWSNCSNRYELKAYNQSDINNEPCYYNITNYTSAEIPLSELTDTCGSKFLFRLVAVDNTCSNEDYYGFGKYIKEYISTLNVGLTPKKGHP